MLIASPVCDAQRRWGSICGLHRYISEPYGFHLLLGPNPLLGQFLNLWPYSLCWRSALTLQSQGDLRYASKKTAVGWDSYTSCQSDSGQLWRQNLQCSFHLRNDLFCVGWGVKLYSRTHSLQCSWTSSLELSVDRPQTTGLVIQPFQTVAEDIFIRSVGPKFSVNLPWNCALEIFSLTIFVTLCLTFCVI